MRRETYVVGDDSRYSKLERLKGGWLGELKRWSLGKTWIIICNLLTYSNSVYRYVIPLQINNVFILWNIELIDYWSF